MISNIFWTQIDLLYRDQPFQRGERLYTSESDVCRRQIMTYMDTEIITIFLMAVHP